MRISASILALSLFAASCSSLLMANTAYQAMPKGEYQLENTHASITWKVSHLGLSNYTARFTDFDAKVQFDPQNIENSTVTAIINPLSVTTDFPNPEKHDFDKKLREDKDWFNGLTYTSITFKSTEIVKTGDNTATMTGDMTMLGVTKPVTFAVTINGAYAEHPFNGKPTLGFSAVGQLDRTAWGFDKYAPMIGKDVDVLLELEFNQP